MTAVDDPQIETADAPTMHGALANLDEEHSYWLDEVVGEVPPDLDYGVVARLSMELPGG